LAGWLLREHANENWDVLSLPAIAEQNEKFRKEGEALWPERFSLETLNRIHDAIGGAAWSSLYQQRPVAAEGAIFKRNWWQLFAQTLAIPFSRIVQSWDTAFKKGAENDFSVCTTWGVAENGYYLLHLWRDRVEFPELKRVLAALADQWKPRAILVEDKASGQSLIQELKRSTVLVRVDSDKQARAQAKRMPTLKRKCTSGCIKPTLVSCGQLRMHWLGSVRTGLACVRSASFPYPRRGSKLCLGRVFAGIAKSTSRLDAGGGPSH
jgi:phage terminase large subunit-like protein